MLTHRYDVIETTNPLQSRTLRLLLQLVHRLVVFCEHPLSTCQFRSDVIQLFRHFRFATFAFLELRAQVVLILLSLHGRNEREILTH